MKAFFKTIGDWVVAATISLVVWFSLFVVAALAVRTYNDIVTVAPIVGWLVIGVIFVVAYAAMEWFTSVVQRIPSWVRVAKQIFAFGRGLVFYTVFFVAAVFTAVANATMWVAEKTMNVAERYQK